MGIVTETVQNSVRQGQDGNGIETGWERDGTGTELIASSLSHVFLRRSDAWKTEANDASNLFNTNFSCFQQRSDQFSLHADI